MPDPSQLQGDMTWGKALAIAFSVGIRPCTGAILVLVFALSQGLLWAGVFATFAMAIGTAITVSILATLAVGSRDLAARFGGEGSGWATLVADSAGIIGASLVLLMGAVFFMGSLQPQAPF
jgi:ABC-type nickel/cobalt efflux system permease component RcnA